MYTDIDNLNFQRRMAEIYAKANPIQKLMLVGKATEKQEQEYFKLCDESLTLLASEMCREMGRMAAQIFTAAAEEWMKKCPVAELLKKNHAD